MMYVITYLMSEWHTVNDYRNDECDNDTTMTMMMMWCACELYSMCLWVITPRGAGLFWTFWRCPLPGGELNRKILSCSFLG